MNILFSDFTVNGVLPPDTVESFSIFDSSLSDSINYKIMMHTFPILNIPSILGVLTTPLLLSRIT